MQAALYDPEDGYYYRKDLVRQGRAGDYRTAPETSPLFAATLAQYFTQAYFDLGAPQRWTIVESGAGAGHFARGVLSTLQSGAPEVFAATHYLIDEISPEAQARPGPISLSLKIRLSLAGFRRSVRRSNARSFFE